jgi:hypothetical protein
MYQLPLGALGRQLLRLTRDECQLVSSNKLAYSSIARNPRQLVALYVTP